MTDPTFSGQVVVVTGSSRGIGLAVAEGFAAADAHVVINGRDADAVDAAVAGIRERGGSALGVVGSSAEVDVVQEILDQVATTWAAPIDVLVTCAGAAEPEGSSILTIEPADFAGLIDAHLTSTFVPMRMIAPGMVARGRGTIVTTSSHAFTGMYAGTGYAAGKGGVVSLTYAVAAELREHGVRVNAICPGAKTRLSTGEEYERVVHGLHERGLINDVILAGSLDPAAPEYCVPAYLALASTATAPITGQVFVAAGGYLGHFPAPTDTFVTWRDHHDQSPWTVAEVADHMHTHLHPAHVSSQPA